MPTFLDRHQIPDATASDIAEAHRLDIEAQSSHDVRFLAYWFDVEEGLACCLADAPSVDAVIAVHEVSHGGVPTDVIVVDKEEVLAFLGRATEPGPNEASAIGFVPDSPLRTVMLTDIVDSVGLTVRLGEVDAVRVFANHDRAVTRVIASNRGRVVKHTGDGFLVSFDHVDDALRAADEIHAAVRAVDDALTVRVAVNPGYPVDRGDDIFGLAVQVASRLCQHAAGGQTLMSGLARELCQDESLKGRCRESGRLALKGLPGAIYTYSIS